MKRISLVISLLITCGGFLIAQGSPEEKMTDMNKTGSFIQEFTSLDDARMAAESGPVVLFFHAQWCPTCRSAKQELEAQESELGDITVFLVDYDSWNELKKRYGVTYQHTFVQIDEEGNSLAIWNGGALDEILDNTVRERME